mmetsp:Transcript_91901/g.287647  ORF Transcript_91901/g.287647 Transcript_91901/m.287647 type:complete len:256 (-) Transcript_91901:78-845(-)
MPAAARQAEARPRVFADLLARDAGAALVRLQAAAPAPAQGRRSGDRQGVLARGGVPDHAEGRPAHEAGPPAPACALQTEPLRGLLADLAVRDVVAAGVLGGEAGAAAPADRRDAQELRGALTDALTGDAPGQRAVLQAAVPAPAGAHLVFAGELLAALLGPDLGAGHKLGAAEEPEPALRGDAEPGHGVLADGLVGDEPRGVVRRQAAAAAPARACQTEPGLGVAARVGRGDVPARGPGRQALAAPAQSLDAEQQ